MLGLKHWIRFFEFKGKLFLFSLLFSQSIRETNRWQLTPLPPCCWAKIRFHIPFVVVVVVVVFFFVFFF